MYFHLIIHTLILIVTLCFGFEAACSMNKDDILNLMDFLVFCFSDYFQRTSKMTDPVIFATSTQAKQ